MVAVVLVYVANVDYLEVVHKFFQGDREHAVLDVPEGVTMVFEDYIKTVGINLFPEGVVPLRIFGDILIVSPRVPQLYYTMPFFFSCHIVSSQETIGMACLDTFAGVIDP